MGNNMMILNHTMRLFELTRPRSLVLTLIALLSFAKCHGESTDLRDGVRSTMSCRRRLPARKRYYQTFNDEDEPLFPEKGSPLSKRSSNGNMEEESLLSNRRRSSVQYVQPPKPNRKSSFFGGF